MSISILNTDAGLSGKTVLTAEGAHTQTGLLTFDRDPNAPFAVAAGSAVVPNLDADKLDGSEGSSYVHKTDDCVWAAYTPTLTNITIGNGTTTARYIQLGKLVHFTVSIIFGSTTSVGGAVSVSLPVALTASSGTITPARILTFDTSGSAYYDGFARVTAASTIALLSGAQPAVAVNTTVPFTWANGDQLYITGTYEAA